MDNQILFTIIILALVTVLFVVAAINSRKVPQKKKAKILARLEELKEQSQNSDTFARRDALIKLDNLLSKSLQLRYSNDNSCGDNLKLAKKLFIKRHYQEIWDVHKLRNDIVHKDTEVSEEQANQAYDIYKMSINKILR